MVTQLYKNIDENKEYCFNIETARGILPRRRCICLRQILADGFLADAVSLAPTLVGERVVEIGPRLNFATAWSSNMVSICRATGLEAVTRVERSRRYLVPGLRISTSFIQTTMTG